MLTENELALETNFLKIEQTNRICYNKQSNSCVHLLRKNGKDYYGNLNEKDVNDNKRFWKTVKPLLPDVVESSEKILLVHEEK